MKACRFCGTEVDNTKRKCPNCGSNELIMVCDNCREHFDGSFCPRCGVKVGQKGNVCPICHTVYFTNACPNCGYATRATVSPVANKNANAGSVEAQRRNSVSKMSRPKRKKKHRLLWILAIIVIAVIYNNSLKNNAPKVNNTKSTIKIDSSTTKNDTSTKKEEKVIEPDEIIPATVEVTSSAPNHVKEQSVAAAVSTSGTAVLSEKETTTSGKNELSSTKSEQAAVGTKDVVVSNNTENIDTENTMSNSSSEIVEQEKISADDVIDDLYQPVTLSFYDASDLKGRGLVDYPGMEPHYVNATGYAVVYTEANLENKSSFTDTPWVVPIYKKIGSGWEKCGTIEHKTKIGILSQELRKQNGREYEGFLEFQELSSGAVAYIDVKNFVTVPYWDLDVLKSIDKGYGVATFKQSSKYTPVYKDGKKVVVKNYTQVLLLARGTYYVSTMDRVDYQIVGVVFDNNDKTGPQYVFFNKNDMTISY